MLENGRIGSVQLLLLLFLIEVATSVFYIPAKITEIGGADAWLSYILASFYGLLVAGAVITLAKNIPCRHLPNICPISSANSPVNFWRQSIR